MTSQSTKRPRSSVVVSADVVEDDLRQRGGIVPGVLRGFHVGIVPGGPYQVVPAHLQSALVQPVDRRQRAGTRRDISPLRPLVLVLHHREIEELRDLLLISRQVFRGMRPLEKAMPLTAVPKRNACLFMRTATSALRPGLPEVSFTTTVRSPLRIFSMRASAALRQAAVASLPS